MPVVALFLWGETMNTHAINMKYGSKLTENYRRDREEVPGKPDDEYYPPTGKKCSDCEHNPKNTSRFYLGRNISESPCAGCFMFFKSKRVC